MFFNKNNQLTNAICDLINLLDIQVVNNSLFDRNDYVLEDPSTNLTIKMDRDKSIWQITYNGFDITDQVNKRAIRKAMNNKIAKHVISQVNREIGNDI